MPEEINATIPLLNAADLYPQEKRRGRPKGSKNKPKTQTANGNLNSDPISKPEMKPEIQIINPSYELPPVPPTPIEYEIGPEQGGTIQNVFQQAKLNAQTPLSQIYSNQDNLCPVCGKKLAEEIAGALPRNSEGYLTHRECMYKTI